MVRSFHNITNKKSMIIDSGQGKMVTSDLFYRSLFDNHPDIVFSLDIKGNLLEANQAFSNILGYSKTEITGTFKRFLPDRDIRQVKEYYYKAINGEAQNVNTALIHKDGYLVELNITVIPNVMNDKVIGVYGIAKDITEKNRIRQQFNSLFSNIHNSAFILNVNGMITDVNEKATWITGYTKEELINQPFTSIVLPEQLEVVVEGFQKVLMGESVTVEFSMLHKDGHVLDFLTIAAPIMVNDEVTGVIGISKDITEERKVKRVLQERKEQYKSLFEHHPDCISYFDLEGNFIDCNPSFEKTLGYTKKELINSSFYRVVHEDFLQKNWNLFLKTVKGEPQRFEVICVHKKGHWVYMDVTNLPIIVDGQIVGVYGIAKDITENKQAELALREAELKYRSIVEESIVGVFIRQNERIVYANPRFNQLLGFAESTVGLDIRKFIHPDDLPNLIINAQKITDAASGIDQSFRMIKKDGSEIDVEAHTTKITYKGEPAIIGTIHDITDRKKSEKLNKYLAYHDSLTHLPNRRQFEEKLEQCLVICRTLQQKCAVMYLDMDRFKYINDTLGHALGDKLLVEISKRLQMHFGDQQVLARMGGDEFTVVLPNVKEINQVIDLAKTLIHSLDDPFVINDYELFITTSIGISLYPNDGEDSQTLMKNADSALYRAKERGKNTYQVYTSSLNVQTYKIFTLERDLRKAIELNQLEIYYQPKVLLESGEIVGAEALIRWNHPEWGVVSPAEFIPIAEETGLILSIGKWIKETVCTQNKVWQQMGLPIIPISINLSAQRFMQKGMVKNIINCLTETKLDPQCLEIEITETTLLENEEVVLSTLEELKNMGVRVALDDFGTGYSSLSYLNRFKDKVDTLKIDRSFISGLEDDDARFVLNTIIQLAHHLKMTVVAEGVENVEQLNILKKYKCDIIQGFLFSKPVITDDFAKLLRKGKLEVIENNVGNPDTTIPNQRKYFRINLDFPLSASMTITRIKGRQVDLGSTEVLIEDIGLGGIRFLSNIKLAIHRDIILEFETVILDKKIKMYGVVVWLNEVQRDIYQYGLELTILENERDHLAGLLNKFAMHLRKSPLAPNCSFVKVNRYNYLRNIKESTSE